MKRIIIVGISLGVLALAAFVGLRQPGTNPASESTTKPPSQAAGSQPRPLPYTAVPLSGTTSSASSIAPSTSARPPESVQALLADSDNSEDLLVAAAMASNPEQRETLLFNALTADPYNALINFLVAEHCLVSPNSAQCGSEVFDMLAQLDGDNGVVNDLQAVQAYRNGDYENALRQIQAGADAEVSDGYRWQQMQATGDALTRLGKPRSAEFVQEVMAITESATGMHLAELSRMCLDQQSDPNWRSACVNRGIALSKGSLSNAGKMFGYGLALSSSAHPETIAQQFDAGLQQQTRQYRDLQKIFTENIMRDKSWQLNTAQWQRFLSIYADVGEVAAMSYLVSGEKAQ